MIFISWPFESSINPQAAVLTMFSAIKKAFGKEEESGAAGENGKKPESPRGNAPGSGVGNGSPGIHQMDASLQRRFARGIQYNSKFFFFCQSHVGYGY